MQRASDVVCKFNYLDARLHCRHELDFHYCNILFVRDLRTVSVGHPQLVNTRHLHMGPSRVAVEASLL